jgi:hypothetical protein
MTGIRTGRKHSYDGRAPTEGTKDCFGQKKTKRIEQQGAKEGKGRSREGSSFGLGEPSTLFGFRVRTSFSNDGLFRALIVFLFTRRGVGIASISCWTSV